jgi:predicted ester cyclase
MPRVGSALGEGNEAVSVEQNKEQNEAVVRRLLEEVFDGKKVVDEIMADGVVDHNKIIFAQPGGPGGVGEGIRMLLVALPDLSVVVERLMGEDDYVAAKVRMAGTNTGPYPRLPEPTGRHTEWGSMVLFRMEGGKIAELWGTSDRMGMLTQLGILPDIG